MYPLLLITYRTVKKCIDCDKKGQRAGVFDRVWRIIDIYECTSLCRQYVLSYECREGKTFYKKNIVWLI